MPSKLIHVTDPHLPPPGRTLCTLDAAARLRAVVDDVNRLHADAAALVLTGDVAYHGLEPGYRLAREILGELTVPCHLLIGNHDDREVFKSCFVDTPVDDGGFVQYAVETPAGSLIMLDTVHHGHEDGEMCAARLDWLEARLEERAGHGVFVFMHHPPFDVGIGSLDACKMVQGAALAKLLKAHGDVRHIFYGHVHRAITGSWHGIPATALPSTNHQVGLLLAESTEMVGTLEPPAYGVVLIDGETVVVHQRYFADESPRFLLMDRRSMDAATAEDLVGLPEQLRGRT
ncbi:MAG: phosphodiesterase [Hyphomicrobiaceae bacterium]